MSSQCNIHSKRVAIHSPSLLNLFLQVLRTSWVTTIICHSLTVSDPTSYMTSILNTVWFKYAKVFNFFTPMWSSFIAIFARSQSWWINRVPGRSRALTIASWTKIRMMPNPSGPSMNTTPLGTLCHSHHWNIWHPNARSSQTIQLKVTFTRWACWSIQFTPTAASRLKCSVKTFRAFDDMHRILSRANTQLCQRSPMAYRTKWKWCWMQRLNWELICTSSQRSVWML